MIRKALIFLNGIFIIWAFMMVFYTLAPELSGWIMADVYLKHGLIAWIMVNTCFLVQVLATVGMIFKNRQLMNFTIPFLLFYGVGGLLVFDWSYQLAPLQVLRLIMTFTVVYFFFAALKKLQIIKLAIWIVIGTVVFVGFKVYQGEYFKANPKIAEYVIAEE